MGLLDAVSSVVVKTPTLKTAFYSFALPLATNVFFLILLTRFDAKYDAYNYYTVPESGSTVDFIVVGAGSAGSVVAARLSENPSHKVLLLESGGPPPPEAYIPGLDFFLYFTEADWGYKVKPQETSMQGFTGKSNLFPRGHVIGGCSGTNFMMYVRGNKYDFDHWAALGNDGWNYETVLEYYKKSENFIGDASAKDLPYHGTGGPLTVSRKDWRTPVAQAFLDAGIELGYGNNDANGVNQTGFSVPHVTIKDGLRASTGEAFLKPNLHRENFEVIPHAHVTKILFEGTRAIGVIFSHKGKEITVYASKEVILSAGAIESPKLLMLSGIGPKEHLQEFGIPVIKDLSGVGQNLQDHPFIYALTWTTNTGTAYSFDDVFSPLTIADYQLNAKGPWSAPIGVEGNAWIPIGSSNSDNPDTQYLIMNIVPTFDYGFLLQTVMGYDRDLYDEYWEEVQGKEGFVIAPTLLKEMSRGSITLNSTNPFEQPIIDVQFLAEQGDVDLMVKAIKKALEIGNTYAMKNQLGAKYHNKTMPGCKNYVFESDEYWACYARSMTVSIYHPAGTCKMAPDSDPEGVVNNKLKVRGVKNLRVIDASIMPVVVSGNTNAASIMIGERGADLIKDDHP